MNVQLDAATGLLPVGEHQLKWREVCKLFGTSAHRKYLTQCLFEVCVVLKKAGVKEVYLDGSFVTSKERPNDYDMSYELTETIFDKLPNDPFKKKDADRIIRGRFAGDIRAEPMHCGSTYRKDLFPNVIDHYHNNKEIVGIKKGIVILPLHTIPDEFGT